MSRLIDADELIKRLWEKSKAQHNIPLVEHDFRELIEEAPTVESVEVGKQYPATDYNVEEELKRGRLYFALVRNKKEQNDEHK